MGAISQAEVFLNALGDLCGCPEFILSLSLSFSSSLSLSLPPHTFWGKIELLEVDGEKRHLSSCVFFFPESALVMFRERRLPGRPGVPVPAASSDRSRLALCCLGSIAGGLQWAGGGGMQQKQHKDAIIVSVGSSKLNS